MLFIKMQCKYELCKKSFLINLIQSIIHNINNPYTFLYLENGGQSKYEILEMLSGGIHLVEMHEKKGNQSTESPYVCIFNTIANCLTGM